MPTSSETKLPLCVRIIRNIATVIGSLFIILVIFVVSAEDLSEPANQYNRDNWNFNSSAARERL
ncbi:hypothetical protein, partial [Candidatus Synechococcus spongiarum]|uniref:hypothetical protein n=1 Tax=Candidatus Synechococcus spongiarum TaxID=431041 RepID=UPI001C5BD7AC